MAKQYLNGYTALFAEIKQDCSKQGRYRAKKLSSLLPEMLAGKFDYEIYFFWFELHYLTI